MNYNTLQYLWDNYFAANPDVSLMVKDGNIWSPNDGSIGQFSSTEDAIKTLKSAGYPDNMIENRDKIT